MRSGCWGNSSRRHTSPSPETLLLGDPEVFPDQRGYIFPPAHSHLIKLLILAVAATVPRPSHLFWWLKAESVAAVALLWYLSCHCSPLIVYRNPPQGLSATTCSSEQDAACLKSAERQQHRWFAWCVPARIHVSLALLPTQKHISCALTLTHRSSSTLTNGGGGLMHNKGASVQTGLQRSVWKVMACLKLKSRTVEHIRSTVQSSVQYRRHACLIGRCVTQYYVRWTRYDPVWDWHNIGVVL